MNLPQTLVRPVPGNITYFYDATGSKLRKSAPGGTRDYIGGIEYNGTAIEQIATEEGRAVPNGAATYTYQYAIKDHLGNTRAMVDQAGAITQVQDYYAFGLEMNPGNGYTASPDNRYKYNGKEKQDETGLYDYGARFYDPVVGRWSVVDGTAEKYLSYSPYHYAGNNPISNYDINGNEFTDEAWKYVNQLLNEINSQQGKNDKDIAGIQAQLDRGGLTTRKINSLNAKLRNLQQNNADLEFGRGEIAMLAAQSQVYNVVESDMLNSSTYEKGGTLFNTKSRAVDIVLPSSAGLGLFAHELKHAYQYLSGTVSISTYDGSNINSIINYFAYDQQDEMEAYTRQGLFGSTQRSLPPEYDKLPKGPINVLDIKDVIILNNYPTKSTP